MTTMRAVVMTLVPAVLYVGCAKLELPPLLTAAHAEIENADGQIVGNATLMETDLGVQIHLHVSGLEPGEHGFHIHENGVCEPPDFASAGGHFNPTGAQHGFNAPGGPHPGDLYNLVVDQTGSAETERTIDGITLGTGETSIMGKAIIIHAGPDDYASQPSGDAGARVACGVIEVDAANATPYPAAP